MLTIVRGDRIVGEPTACPVIDPTVQLFLIGRQ